MCDYNYSELNFINKLPTCFYRGKEYFVWQDDEFCRVAFSEIPRIENKLINTLAMTKDEIKAAKKKPLYVENQVEVLVVDKKKKRNFVFTIKAGYDYDGASIPRFFTRLIGSKEDVRFKVASLIHDIFCENKHYVDYDRYFADKVFERLLSVADTCAFNRWLIFHSVDNYQKFCGWRNKEK
ncbi:MAG: hypothetical protein DKM22_04340 [Candidatus Melainabacteria bacterium]|nr:MAG: hypothetical protein DKM22_04340 [Candidatus Melainabacteria bacterium]